MAHAGERCVIGQSASSCVQARLTAAPAPCWNLVATDAAQGPEARAQAHQRTALLAEAIEALPQQEKVVIALYYNEELTMKEIGEVPRGVRMAGLANPYQGHLPSPEHAHSPLGRLSIAAWPQGLWWTDASRPTVHAGVRPLWRAGGRFQPSWLPRAHDASPPRRSILLFSQRSVCLVT